MSLPKILSITTAALLVVAGGVYWGWMKKDFFMNSEAQIRAGQVQELNSFLSPGKKSELDTLLAEVPASFSYDQFQYKEDMEKYWQYYDPEGFVGFTFIYPKGYSVLLDNSTRSTVPHILWPKFSGPDRDPYFQFHIYDKTENTQNEFRKNFQERSALIVKEQSISVQNFPGKFFILFFENKSTFIPVIVFSTPTSTYQLSIRGDQEVSDIKEWRQFIQLAHSLQITEKYSIPPTLKQDLEDVMKNIPDTFSFDQFDHTKNSFRYDFSQFGFSFWYPQNQGWYLVPSNPKNETDNTVSSSGFYLNPPELICCDTLFMFSMVRDGEKTNVLERYLESYEEKSTIPPHLPYILKSVSFHGNKGVIIVRKGTGALFYIVEAYVQDEENRRFYSFRNPSDKQRDLEVFIQILHSFFPSQ